MPDTVEEDRLAIQLAQLNDMPFEVIEGWLTMRGWVVVSRDWHRRHAAQDALRAVRFPLGVDEREST